jgi:hypothetical protein
MAKAKGKAKSLTASELEIKVARHLQRQLTPTISAGSTSTPAFAFGGARDLSVSPSRIDMSLSKLLANLRPNMATASDGAQGEKHEHEHAHELKLMKKMMKKMKGDKSRRRELKLMKKGDALKIEASKNKMKKKREAKKHEAKEKREAKEKHEAKLKEKAEAEAKQKAGAGLKLNLKHHGGASLNLKALAPKSLSDAKSNASSSSISAAQGRAAKDAMLRHMHSHPHSHSHSSSQTKPAGTQRSQLNELAIKRMASGRGGEKRTHDKNKRPMKRA